MMTAVTALSRRSFLKVAGGVVDALHSGATAAAAAERATEGTEAQHDNNATVEYREHLARVLVRRALEESGLN